MPEIESETDDPNDVFRIFGYPTAWQLKGGKISLIIECADLTESLSALGLMSRLEARRLELEKRFGSQIPPKPMGPYHGG